MNNFTIIAFNLHNTWGGGAGSVTVRSMDCKHSKIFKGRDSPWSSELGEGCLALFKSCLLDKEYSSVLFGKA